MNSDQGQFNFDGNGTEDGYRRWRDELDSARLAFERRWGVILNRRVSVTLEDHHKPLVGVLRVVSDLKTKRSGPPEFEMAGLKFRATSIRSVVQMDEASEI